VITRFVNLRVPAGDDDTRSAELVVDDGRFAAVLPVGASEAANGCDDAAKCVDLGGALVLPGVIDGHVHFDDPGYTERENFATGTAAAAAGGVTCIADMPGTSVPEVTTAANLRRKLEVVAPRAHVDFVFWGGMSGNAIEDPAWRENLAGIVEEGVGAIKLYTLSGMDTFRDLTYEQIGQVLEETRALGIPVGVHAEDRSFVLGLTKRLQAEGRSTPLDYAASRPPEGERLAVEELSELCARTGARVHIVHLASAVALDVVSEVRDDGLPMTAETCPHFLAFTAEDLERQGAILKTAPVVKGARDRERLWVGLASGELETVATDHAAGVWPAEKHTGSIWTDYGGVPGVELMLPYLYSEGVRKGRITLERLAEVTASAPARLFGIDGRKGRIAPGFDADFVVLDEDERWTVRAAELHNLNRYTPLEGRELTGRVRATYVRGRQAYRREADGAETFGAPGSGEWVRRETHLG